MTGAELVPRLTAGPYQATGRQWIELLAPAAELAKSIAGTDFVPKALRHNPAAIAAAILYGDEVGLGPLQSLSKIAVIDGKPALAAEAQRALVLAAGHDLWLEQYGVTAVTVAGKRKGSDVSNRVTWTLDDARRANLAGRPSWRAYPRQMLLARASAELCRSVFPDVIGGLAALEELDEPDPDQAPAAGTELRLAQGRTKRVRRPKVAELEPDAELEPPAPDEMTDLAARAAAPTATISAPSPEPTEPPIPGEPGTSKMSEPQKRKLFAAFRDAGYQGQGSRARRLAFTAEFLDRPIESAAELTADEAARLIDVLETASELERESPQGIAPEGGAGTPLPASPPTSAGGSDLPVDPPAGDQTGELWDLFDPDRAL